MDIIGRIKIIFALFVVLSAINVSYARPNLSKLPGAALNVSSDMMKDFQTSISDAGTKIKHYSDTLKDSIFDTEKLDIFHLPSIFQPQNTSLTDLKPASVATAVPEAKAPPMAEAAPAVQTPPAAGAPLAQ